MENIIPNLNYIKIKFTKETIAGEATMQKILRELELHQFAMSAAFTVLNGVPFGLIADTPDGIKKVII